MSNNVNLVFRTATPFTSALLKNISGKNLLIQHLQHRHFLAYFHTQSNYNYNLAQKNWQPKRYFTSGIENSLHKLVLDKIRKKPQLLKNLGNERDNEETVLTAVSQDGMLLREASLRLQNSKKVVLEAIRNNGHAIRYASKDFQKDADIVKIAYNRSGHEIFERILDSPLLDDREFLFPLIQMDVRIIDVATDRIKNDREILLFCLRTLEKTDKSWVIATSEALVKTINGQLKDDDVVMYSFLEICGDNWRYASERLQNDDKFMRKAWERISSWECYRIISNYQYYKINPLSKDLSDDEEFMLELVKKSGSFLCLASMRLQDQLDFINAALVQTNEPNEAIRYVSERLRKNKSFILAYRGQLTLPLIHESLRDDPTIMTRAFKTASDFSNQVEIIKALGPNLQNNKGYVGRLLKIEPLLFCNIVKELRNDANIALSVSEMLEEKYDLTRQYVMTAYTARDPNTARDIRIAEENLDNTLSYIGDELRNNPDFLALCSSRVRWRLENPNTMSGFYKH